MRQWKILLVSHTDVEIRNRKLKPSLEACTPGGGLSGLKVRKWVAAMGVS